MGNIRSRAAAVLTIIAISMSALIVGVPAANAASSPAAPTCNQWLSWLPAEAAKCKARSLWLTLNADAAKVGAEKNAQKRLTIVMKDYYAIAAPLAHSQSQSHLRNHYMGEFDQYAQTATNWSNASPAKAKAMVIYLRDFVARHQKNLNQMNASIVTLQGLAKIGNPIYKKNANAFIKNAGVPFVRDSYMKAAADTFSQEMKMKH